jgi:Na+/H+-dicarboxylate symporter
VDAGGIRVGCGLRDGLARTARDDGPWVSGFLSVLGVLGTLFMRALKMVVVPLVIASLVSGMAGLALNFVPASTRDRVLPVVDAILAMMMKITHAIIMLAPLGVFALVTRLIAETEPGVLKPLLPYALTVALGLVVHFFLTLPLTMERAEKGVGVSNRVASFVLPIGATEKELESVRLDE